MAEQNTSQLTRDDLEHLVDAWILMSANVRGNRLLRDLSLSEMLLCRFILNAQSVGEPITASILCEKTGMLKSQANRLLDGLEKKGWITRTRSLKDHRRIELTMNEDAISRYNKEHDTILTILQSLDKGMGAEQVRQLTSLLETATKSIRQASKNGQALQPE